MSASDSYVDQTGGWIRTVWDMIFAGLAVATVVWFIARMFQREPDWRY